MRQLSSNIAALILCVEFLVISIEAVNIRILVESDESDGSPAPLNEATAADTCKKSYTSVDPTTVTFFPSYLNGRNPPWLNPDLPNVKLWTSEALTVQWEALLKLKVQGIPGRSLQDIFQYYYDKGCMMITWGGAVRDLVLNTSVADIDAEFYCDPSEAFQLCKVKFTDNNCALNTGGEFPALHIGNPTSESEKLEPMDAFNWKKSLYAKPVDWEYTANALAFYDDDQRNGHRIIFDPLGIGVADICDRLIRIPVSSDQFHAWYAGNRTNQVLRFWKLRYKGFTVADDITLQFINTTVRENVKIFDFLKFYCGAVYNGLFGKFSDHGTYHCIVRRPINQTKANIYNDNFKQDIGIDYWNEYLEGWLKQLDVQLSQETTSASLSTTTSNDLSKPTSDDLSTTTSIDSQITTQSPCAQGGRLLRDCGASKSCAKTAVYALIPAAIVEIFLNEPINALGKKWIDFFS